MKEEPLITFNRGSSSLKIGIFNLTAHGALRLASAAVDFGHAPLSLDITQGQHKQHKRSFSLGCDAADEVTLLKEILAILKLQIDLRRIVRVAHRVVHGGDEFDSLTLIDDEVLAAIERLGVFAPLHQPQSIALIRALQSVNPFLRQYASFDTAFHRTNGDIVQRFALPRVMHDQGIKRYGFHGLSYTSIIKQLQKIAPTAAQGKVVVAHLGSGASLCGIDNGVSRDTSMGFSTLDGIPMATRCGALDPGVILYLLEQKNMSSSELSEILYHQSGLLGVSGISADTRDLLGEDKPEAKQAIDLFVLRIAGEIARLAATLGGIDALVFTAGIGEHQPDIRRAIAERCRWLGAALDDFANNAGTTVVSAPASRVKIFVIATDEEQVMADQTAVLVNSQINVS
ncbi:MULTISPECIES: acetate/propionate family kinase [Rhizobium/Agrobacterium group]|nr:acetate/propionate family kinase [Rhizobium rhizogenes]